MENGNKARACCGGKKVTLDYCKDCGCPLDVCCGQQLQKELRKVIERFYKKLGKQGAMVAHWKVAELMFELEKELGLKGKSSVEIIHEYRKAEEEKFLKLAKGEKKKAKKKAIK